MTNQIRSKRAYRGRYPPFTHIGLHPLQAANSSQAQSTPASTACTAMLRQQINCQICSWPPSCQLFSLPFPPSSPNPPPPASANDPAGHHDIAPVPPETSSPPPLLPRSAMLLLLAFAHSDRSANQKSPHCDTACTADRTQIPAAPPPAANTSYKPTPSAFLPHREAAAKSSVHRFSNSPELSRPRPHRSSARNPCYRPDRHSLCRWRSSPANLRSAAR